MNAEKTPHGQTDILFSEINLPSRSTNACWEIPYERMIPLPLENLLLRLSEGCRRITIAEWERLFYVLSCNGTWTLRRLRNIICSLFAKNEEEVSMFERRFDDIFGFVSDCKPPDIERINEFRTLMKVSVYRSLPEEHTKRVAEGERVLSKVSGIKEKELKKPGSQVKIPKVIGKDSMKQDEGPGKSAGEHVLPRLKFYDLWLTLGKIDLNIIDIPIKKWKDEESLIWDPLLPHIFPWYQLGGEFPACMDFDSIDYLADCIGYYQAEIPGNNLDIPASIKASIEAAGIPRFAFLPVRMPRTLIILEDVFAKARQWNPIAREFSREMQLRGINVLHGIFSGSPLRFHTSSGEHLYLEDIEYERSGAIVLIFSDSQCIRHTDSRVTLEDLAQWPNLAWLDLREPRSWDRATLAINTFGIDVHPASKEGITCAIRKFLTETGTIPDWFVETSFNKDFYDPDIPLDIYLSCFLGCALPWAQACSLLQPISYKLAERLRQIFFPDIPKEAIERLHDLPGTTITVSGMHFDREVCSILLKGFYEYIKYDSDIHKRIMKFIIKEILRVKNKIPKGIPSHPCLASTIGEVHLLQLKRGLLLNAGKKSICKNNCGLCPTQLKELCPQKRLNDLVEKFPQLEDMITKFQEWFSIPEEVERQPPPEMALIHKNSFRMGDSYAEGFLNEIPVHEVWIGAFYMDVYPVTGKLWREVFQWAVKKGYDFDNEGAGKGPHHPVTGISWYDAVKWANARSEMMGREPVYYTNGTHRRVYIRGRIDLTQEAVLWDADGFRLPTEAEWEKASRGGLDGHHYPWEGQGRVYKRFIDRERANYNNEGTTEIGKYAPNGYGLYDMTGNVWEWCWDWYDPEWYGKSEADCRGPAAGENRVCRGGSWFAGPIHLRCLYRNFEEPGLTGDMISGLGLRLVIGQGRVRRYGG